MKNLLTAIVFTSLVALLSTNAYAADGKYKGSKGIYILVEKLKDKGKKCGFTEDALKTAASFPIITGTKLKKSISGIVFYINITALASNRGCIASWEVMIYNHQKVKLDYGPKSLFTVVLDDAGGMYKGPNTYVVNTIIKRIENTAKKFAVQWTIDNQ